MRHPCRRHYPEGVQENSPGLAQRRSREAPPWVTSHHRDPTLKGLNNPVRDRALLRPVLRPERRPSAFNTQSATPPNRRPPITRHVITLEEVRAGCHWWLAYQCLGASPGDARKNAYRTVELPAFAIRRVPLGLPTSGDRDPPPPKSQAKKMRNEPKKPSWRPENAASSARTNPSKRLQRPQSRLAPGPSRTRSRGRASPQRMLPTGRPSCTDYRDRCRLPLNGQCAPSTPLAGNPVSSLASESTFAAASVGGPLAGL
jgi:hypothetical protein